MCIRDRAEAKRLGQPALAITDHGYMFGAYEFYAAATAAGIKPIIGGRGVHDSGHLPLRQDPCVLGR